MPRRSAEAALPMPGSDRQWLRLGLGMAAATTAVVLGVLAFIQIEHLLIRDPRFHLTAPDEPGKSGRNLRLEGLHYASEAQVAAVFGRDFGRSIYLCPLEARRRQLLAIDWVKDASLSRIWPNKLVARISERTPVAFAQLSTSAGNLNYQLIDGDGVLLDPRRAMRLDLPVLTGMRKEDTPEVRRDRVKRLIRLREEVGPHMQKISEIDISDLDNLKVTQQFQNRAIVLMLGDKNFKRRLENFLNNADEIRKRMPDATVLDLRMRDRIVAVEGRNHAQ